MKHAVILAGGKGTRLYPYTVTFPKPLVPVADMPILEIVIRQLKKAGFTHITMAVGHLAELLMAYFGDGSKWDVVIRYSREDKPLGTVGPLKLIPDLDQAPFLVMNGDVLTDLDYQQLWSYHQQEECAVTIASHTRDVRIDLGVLTVRDDYQLSGYLEKPVYHYQVSMGIYIFSPQVLQYVPDNEYYDFPTLILQLLQKEQCVKVYPFAGYWLDIGRPDDYAEATAQFQALRAKFVPE